MMGTINDVDDKRIYDELYKINESIIDLNKKDNKTNDDYNKLTVLYFNQLLKGMQLSKNFQ